MAHRIYVLGAAHVEDKGGTEELVDLKGLYYAMCWSGGRLARGAAIEAARPAGAARIWAPAAANHSVTPGRTLVSSDTILFHFTTVDFVGLMGMGSPCNTSRGPLPRACLPNETAAVRVVVAGSRP